MFYMSTHTAQKIGHLLYQRLRFACAMRWLPLLLALPAASPASTITDNFTLPSNWGTPTTSQGGNLSVGNGRMNYTASLTNNAFAATLRKTPILPTTNDWSLKVDAHLNSSTLTTEGQFCDVFLGFGKTGDWLNTHVAFEFGRGYWGNPAHNGYYIQDDVSTNGVNFTWGNKLFENWNITSADVSLRMDYNAANHAITYYFDSDGAANGYTWVAQGTANLASGTYNLHLGSTDTLTILLVGSSELQTVAAGQAYLSNLEITMLPPQPAIITQPASRTNEVGTTATFTVTATGTAPLAYQWRVNGASLANGGNVSGAASATLSLANVQLWDAGSYSVVVTNSYGSVTSSVAVLAVRINASTSCAGDDFSAPAPDPTKWGPDIILGPGGQFAQTNGVLRFLGTNSVVQPWIFSYGSYTQDWQVAADVHLGNVALTENPAHVQIFLAVCNAQDSNLLTYGLPGDNFSIALDLYRDPWGASERSYEAYFRTNRGEILPRSTTLTASLDGNLRIAFDSRARTLSSYYDGNLLRTVNIAQAGSSWEMTDTSTFLLSLGVGSGGFTADSDDQVYADNFLVCGGVPAPAAMALIPAGPFQMGNNNTNELGNQWVEYPEHTVYVGAFRVDRFKVTHEQMRCVLQWAYDTGRVFADAGTVINLEGDHQRLMVLDDKDSRLGFTNGIFFVKENHEAFPCAEVTWYGAQAYCNYRSAMEGLAFCINFTNWTCDFGQTGYRLPTEAEWEKAARGGLTGHHYPWPSYGGSYSNHIDGTQANYEFSGDPYGSGDAGNNLATTPVGYFNGGQVVTNQASQLLPGRDMANGYGLYDMAGNLFEWCWDWGDVAWYRQPGATNDNTAGPLVATPNILGAAEKVMRGGAWEDPIEELRCSNRAFNEPEDKGNGIGFRCVRTAMASNDPPAITFQPQSQTNTAGSTTWLSTGAVGTGWLSYQWRKNGTNLDGEGATFGITTPNLTITNALPGDASSYSVVVSNAYGSVTSSVAILTVALPYTWITNIDGTITITSYTGSDRVVAIPCVINGLPVTSIGMGAFFRCTNLTSVTIPNSIRSIASYGISSCASLTNLTIPASVTNIGAGAFPYCVSLSAIMVDATNSFYSSVDGVSFNRNQTLLVQCPAAKSGVYLVPNGVTTIGAGAFAGCRSLASIIIHNNLTNIGGGAFEACSNMTTMYFQGNAPSLAYVFVDLTGLTVYYLPGTTGWAVTFGGRPTALWPPVQISGSNFGLRTNQFGFSFLGITNAFIVVEASTNLTNPLWLPVGTNILSNGSSYFSDPQTTNSSRRFYRLRSP